MARKQRTSPEPPPQVDLLDLTTAYARAVVEGGGWAEELRRAWPHLELDGQGRILASRLVRLSCERHLRDRERPDLYFDVEAAEHGVAFFRDVLRLEDDSPFALSPHQAFIFGSAYGWKTLDGDLRFRILYVEVAKGDGKSPSGAGFIDRGVCAEGQLAAECYVAAAKKDQAMIAFRDCCRMARQSPALAKRLKPSGTFPHTWNLAHVESGSFARPISSEDAQSGPRVYRALIDELHEHKSSNVLDMMVAGTKGRRNALILIITNSGFDLESVCWREHAYSLKVLRGEHVDDSRFAYIAGLDPCEKCAKEGREFPTEGCADCDDWRDERVWTKANPNLGVTITLDYLRKQVNEAAGMPAKQSVVKRLNFCIWTEQEARWLDMDLWDACGAPATLEALAGQTCYGGLDLASVDDLTALALVFPRESSVQLTAETAAELEPDDDEEPWPVLWRFWMPEATFRKRAAEQRLPWREWRDAGLLKVTPGNMTDYAFIRTDIGELGERVVIREVAVDRWNASYLMTQLEQDGLTVVAFGQGFRDMSPPVKVLGAMVKARRIAHGGNRLARWMATNVAVLTDAAGNIKFDKEHARDKIDGFPALAMGLSRALAHQGMPQGSVYETRGALVL